MKKIIIAILITLLWPGCNIDRDYQPERVEGIPKDAFWVGGPDGGQWYIIENINKEMGTANFKIFNDHSGTLEISRNFKLKCDSEVVIAWDNLEKKIDAFDGQSIILNILNKEGKYCYFQ